MLIHEKSYKGFGLRKLHHRKRLEEIVSILKGIPLQNVGTLADFGCSNGFILEVVQKEIPILRHWTFFGFDHQKELLLLAKERLLSNAKFHCIDLNILNDCHINDFDIVTCFETLEHTGNYRNAFENLYLSCKAGGFIIVSIPNEIGLTGILKYVGRKMRRWDTYGDFFNRQSEFKYIVCLLAHGSIESFRNPDRSGWGPHLGFDYRTFEKIIEENYVMKRKLKLLKRSNAFLGFNKLYLFRKTG